MLKLACHRAAVTAEFPHCGTIKDDSILFYLKKLVMTVFFLLIVEINNNFNAQCLQKMYSVVIIKPSFPNDCRSAPWID